MDPFEAHLRNRRAGEMLAVHARRSPWVLTGSSAGLRISE
jgi:hypothetical protein